MKTKNVSIESSSRSKEGHGGQQMSPELLNETFSMKSTQFRPWKCRKKPNDTLFAIVLSRYVAAGVVTDTHTHKERLPYPLHMCRGLTTLTRNFSDIHHQLYLSCICTEHLALLILLNFVTLTLGSCARGIVVTPCASVCLLPGYH